MKRQVMIAFIITIFLFQIVAISAVSASQARQDWMDSKQATRTAQAAHQQAKLDFASDNSQTNEQAVIDTGKVLLHATLDEVEAWLNWKKLETDESPVSKDLKQDIKSDVQKNIETINSLRTEVDNVNTRFELGVTFLKMVQKYGELLTDVARNTGAVWVYVANDRADTIEDYEQRLRAAANSIQDNSDIIAKLDLAKAELNSARLNIDKAESIYKQVMHPGTPFLKFGEGNNYLNSARLNLISAAGNLHQAFRLISLS